MEKEELEKSRTSVKSFFLIIVCTLFTSIGQIFFKLGSETAFLDLSLLTNYNLMIGLVLYASGAFLLIIALKGGELSVLYPVIATSYIWVSLIAKFYFNENLSLFNIIGVAFVMIGISFVGIGSRK